MKEAKATNLISQKFAAAILTCIICVLFTSKIYAEDVQLETGYCGAGDDNTNVTFTVYDTDGDEAGDKLVISGSGEMDVYESPAKVPWISYSSTLKSVVIEDNVTSIGSYAFGACTAITSVSIPDGVTNIGESAFLGCSSLTNISIPESVISLGAYSFAGCSKLTELSIPDSGVSIGEYAFYNCVGLKEMIIPDSVKSIENKALGFTGNYISDGKIDGFVIKGNLGSEAERYANANGITFASLTSQTLAVSDDGHRTYYIEGANGWNMVKDDATGEYNSYWYENGFRQGYDADDNSYRGKEIYDPDTDAWYWLDNINAGKKAVSKDVYQESQADDEGNIGKWVRYDANGYMIKGWDERQDKELDKESGKWVTKINKYYFEPTYGTMVKGYYTIGSIEYYFNTTTGIMESVVAGGLYSAEGGYTGWKTIGDDDYWYEDGKRQGYSTDAAYRGKEIWDPATDAWYWLDNVDGGKKAVSKDVYQESLADDEGNIGKWVRYDANGRMIKGWSAGYGEDARTIGSPDDANGEAVYYFDPTYGTMAKGEVTIDGAVYTFDTTYGTLIQ
jgi:hypothetical protein